MTGITRRQDGERNGELGGGCGCVRVDGGDSGGDGGSEMRRWIRNVHDGAAEERRGKDLYVQGRGEGVVRCEDQKRK